MNTEYVICILLGDYKKGEELISWPLHITLVPWFATDDIEKLKYNLADVLGHDHQILVAVGEERTWGPNSVNVIENSTPLHDMHNRVLTLIETSGKLLVNKQYTGINYTPHITHQKSLAKRPGDNVIINNVYIVERDIESRQKKVTMKVALPK